jgi:pimeloyl-ACP methyl ester carboxylesterase
VSGAVLVLLVGAPKVLPGSTVAPSRPTPTPTTPRDLLPPAPRSDVPVLLIHGYAGAPSQMKALADRLTRDGRRVVIMPLPERATVDIRVSALAVVVAARNLHVPQVDVVGYSLGGIAARQALLFTGGFIHIRRLVMLATPNHGVSLPDDSGRPEQKHCEPTNACGQLKPKSPFLDALNKSPLARANPGWLTIASKTDKLVRPPSMVALAGARNLVLQDVCPGATEGHTQMDDAPSIVGLAVLFLDGRMPAAPVCDEALGADAA